MATVFSDAFTDTATTAVTSHTPNTGTSWTAGTGCTSPLVSNANRARTSGDGAQDFIVANPASALSTHDYTVEADWNVISVDSAASTGPRLYSHASASSPPSSASAIANGYALKGTISQVPGPVLDVQGYRNGSAILSFPAAFAVSAGEAYHPSIETATSGADCVVKFYFQRNTDNFYLKSDGTWTATKTPVHAEANYTDTSALSVGSGGLGLYAISGDTKDVHVDNFTITAAAGGGGSPPVGSAYMLRQSVKRPSA